ncbi:MAG: hypothetical protein IJ511_01715 [Bacteroides sp.]|nr:hypothetical protein [Bacteroides sp.]
MSHHIRKNLLLSLFCCLILLLQAAEPVDSLQTTHKSASTPRHLSLSAELAMRPGGDYRVEQEGESVELGRNDLYTKASVRASMPIYQNGSTLISSSLRYTHIHQHFNPEVQLLDYGFGATAHHIFAANIMGMGKVKLGRKSLMLMGMVSGECSQYGLERWTAIGTAVLMLKETRRTQFGIGVLGMVNTLSKIPVFPFFTYRHTFNEQWMVNLVLPNLQVRYTLSPSDFISLGMSIDADHYFIHPNTKGLPDRVRYSRCVQNFGPIFEHRFASGLSLTVDMGLSMLMADRVHKSGGSTKIAEVHEKAVPYGKVTIQKRF